MFSFFLSLQYYEMSYGLNVEMHKQVIFDALILKKKKGYLVSKIVLTYCEKKLF